MLQKREWLIEARKKKGLSRAELGYMTDLHETYIEKIENGSRTPRIPIAMRIGRVLDIAPEIIFEKFFIEPYRQHHISTS